MESSQKSDNPRQFLHGGIQLAHRPLAKRNTPKDMSFPLRYYNSPCLCLGFRAVQRSYDKKDASLWRDDVGHRRVAFRHTCTIKINVDSCRSGSYGSIGQTVWVDSHETNVFGIGLKGEMPDSLLIRDVFIVSTAGSFPRKSLLYDLSLQDESKFTVSVTLSFNNEAAAKDILSIVDPFCPEDVIKQAVLTAQHFITPAISPKTVMLPISLLSPNRTETLEYRMIMEWDWRRQRLPNHGLPALSRHQLQPSHELRPKVRVVYCFVSGHKSYQFDFDDLSCPFCESEEFMNLDNLFTHLRTSHDFLKFSLDRREIDDTVIRAKFSILIKHHSEMESFSSRAGSERHQYKHISDQTPKDEPEEISIHRKLPSVPSEYARRSTGSNLYEKRARVGFPKVQELSECKDTDHDDLSSVLKESVAVNGLFNNTNKHKKTRVPKAPNGVTFFHTVTKRPLLEGESVSESDDEVDQSWLKAKHMQSLADFEGLEPPTIELLQKYDDHFWEERLHGNKLTTPVLIRFARDNKSFLNEGCIRSEFLYKASCMIPSGANDIFTVEKLIQILDPKVPDQTRTKISRHTNERKSGHLNASPKDFSSNRQVVSGLWVDSSVLHEENSRNLQQCNGKHGKVITPRRKEKSEMNKWNPNTCTCGKHATDVGDIIVCSNSKCGNEPFHRTCVGVKEMRTDWLCPACSATDLSEP